MPLHGFTLRCPSCTKFLPLDARFCPQCGTRLGAGETLELNPDPVLANGARDGVPTPEPPSESVHQAQRRPLGVHPTPLVGGVGILALLLAIILSADGSLAPGLILAGLAVGLFALFGGGVRREPDAPTALFARRAVDRLRSRVGMAAVVVRARLRMARDLLRVRRRQHRLRSELKASLAPLGEAIHHDDRARAEALKQRAAELERELSDAEREASAAVAAGRQEIERERAAADRTAALTPLELDRIERSRPS